MNTATWLKIIGAIAALAAAGFALKLVLKSKQRDVTKVTQKGNIIGGDNAGRDIKK